MINEEKAEQTKQDTIAQNEEGTSYENSSAMVNGESSHHHGLLVVDELKFPFQIVTKDQSTLKDDENEHDAKNEVDAITNFSQVQNEHVTAEIETTSEIMHWRSVLVGWKYTGVVRLFLFWIFFRYIRSSFLPA